MSVTQNDMLDALREAMQAPPLGDGFTGTELCERLGVCSATMRRVVRQKLADGTLEVVQLRRTRINGISITMPGYRLKL